MRDLASLGLSVRTCNPIHQGEQRLEVRLVSTGAFVAWFQTHGRASDTERVVTTNTQFVDRDELSDEQRTGVEEWLQEQMRAAN